MIINCNNGLSNRMRRVKIYGAGSIGNHLANAARRLNWAVDISDVDPEALIRTKSQIYPSRYGSWDQEIGLFVRADAPVGGYDLIVIGTPPDTHIMLAREAIKERPKAILVEKPVCTPDLSGAQDLFDEAKAMGVNVFVGYDHVVGKAGQEVASLIEQQAVGNLETLDVEFREYWGGVFDAHPWLDGPKDSYLGFWRRGGGACGEHSHAINLWQFFAHKANAGRVISVSAQLEYFNDGTVDYDKLCLLNLKTEKGLLGRVVQDVVTRPTRKWARAQFSAGYTEWFCGIEPGKDAVHCVFDNGMLRETIVHKTRPDDFVEELKHIDQHLDNVNASSPISLERGLETMMIIAAAHKSAAERREVTIDYSRGFDLDALS